MRHHLRNPLTASIFAFFVTYIFLKLKSQMAGKEEPNHRYIKPSFLIGILVYFIIYIGNTNTEPYDIN